MADKSTSIRNEERCMIKQCCEEYTPFNNLPKYAQNKIVKNIESSILNSTIDKALGMHIPAYWDNTNFLEIYNSTGYRVKMNLSVNSSINKNLSNGAKDYLISRIIKHYLLSLKLSNSILQIINQYYITISPSKVGYLNSQNLNPHINALIVNEIKIRENQFIKVKYSTMYKCETCGEKKTQMREIQTCSSDEGGTLFIDCLNCGHTWRQYS